MVKNERNDYIDMLRGLAALAIISTHTAYYSGSYYTPVWFKSITILLDVPFFYFLSGWGSSYRKADIVIACKGVGRIWAKWIYFISIVGIFCFVSRWLPVRIDGIADFRDLINNYMFNVSVKGLPVISQSLWFMPWYFVVIVANTLVMMVFDKTERKEQYTKFYCVILAFLLLWITYGRYSFSIDVIFVFYSFFWMLGQNKQYIKQLETWKFLAGILIAITGLFLSSCMLDIPLYHIQASKFPPTIMFGFCSMITILLAVYLEPKIKIRSRLLIHIGRNAIFYFFAQGIGSTVLYYLLDYMDMESRLLKWTILFIVNCAATMVLAEAFAYTYTKLSSIIAFAIGRWRARYPSRPLDSKK